MEASASTTLPKAYISNPYKIGILGIILGSVALQLNITALPLVIMQDLGGTLEQVGINASVAAAVEVPCMVAWGYLALRMSKEIILATSSAIFALYLGLMSIAETVLQVLFLQGLAALAVAALLSINISYLQEAIKGRLGLSTSLVDVSRVLINAGSFDRVCPASGRVLRIIVGDSCDHCFGRDRLNAGGKTTGRKI